MIISDDHGINAGNDDYIVDLFLDSNNPVSVVVIVTTTLHKIAYPRCKDSKLPSLKSP